MAEKDVMQIRVNHKLVGVVGLQQVMGKMAEQYAGRSGDEIGVEMVTRLGKDNYIPNRARPLYAQAFVQEFRKYLGQSIDETPVQELRVAVLGPGCDQCSRMEMDVREVMAEMKLPGELIHISDIREIGKYGVMGFPALVINERLICVGQTPHRNQIKAWLQEAMSSDKKE